jgi:hypothetical protein
MARCEKHKQVGTGLCDGCLFEENQRLKVELTKADECEVNRSRRRRVTKHDGIWPETAWGRGPKSKATKL